MKSIVTVVGETQPETYNSIGLTSEELLSMLQAMLRIRRFEEKVEQLFAEGKMVGPSHLYLGQEAVAVGVMKALGPEDQIVSTYRGHGHAIARGVPIKSLMAELLGKETGTCKGIGGSMHVGISPPHGIQAVTAIVGSGIPIAAGIGLAMMYTGKKSIAVVFFGDGAVNTGAFHEGLNLASVWRLPVLFVCENNLYAEFTAHGSVFAGESIASRASAYRMRALEVFGNDVVSVYTSARDAVNHLRAGHGPVFIECRTYRMKGHGVYDTAWYRPKDEVEAWLKRDPIAIFTANLRKLGLLTDEKLRQIDAEIKKEIDSSVEDAARAPTLPFEQLYDMVYAPSSG